MEGNGGDRHGPLEDRMTLAEERYASWLLQRGVAMQDVALTFGTSAQAVGRVLGALGLPGRTPSRAGRPTRGGVGDGGAVACPAR